MEYLLVSLVALAASGLTFVSGFGLGTLLLPAFLLFFPAEHAVAMTGVVHFLNNVFKLVLIGRRAERSVVLRFGLPAIPAAFGGAWILGKASGLPAVFRYAAGGRIVEVLPVGLLMGALIALFGILELHPRSRSVGFSPRFLTLGGVLSGFFGGLSGHQGALRSAFLARVGLSPEAFIGTGVVIACFIDLTRLGVYGVHLGATRPDGSLPLLLAATISAWLGALVGRRILRTSTMTGVRTVVGALLMVVAAGLMSGLF